MGSGSRFRLPTALRRSKSSAQPNVQQPDRQPDGKEHKVQHLLGITETDLNTARNQSITSSVTAKIPTLAFSDATTEFGSSYPPTDQSDTARDIQLKASSVLLHEEFLLKADANSTHSKGLRTRTSASTLNSFYDAQKTPLVISQQTSDSSRRDFALRKGSPVVVKPVSPDKDLLKLFRLSRSGDKACTKKLTKPYPQPPESPGKMIFGTQRSIGSSHSAATSGFLHSTHQTPPKKGVRFNSGRPGETPSPVNLRSKPSIASTSQHSAVQVKVNIRRPKAGAKYWFDGLEGDSSDDESVHEPELQSSFVAGIESAFEGGRIAAIVREDPLSTVALSDVSLSSLTTKPPSKHTLPPSAIPPRASTLKAKSSKSSLSRKESHLSSPKAKASSLASTDLHKTSILDLSASDDDESSAQIWKSNIVSLPPLRDSIAVESLVESEIEIATAKAIRTRLNTPLQATPSLKRIRGGHPRRDTRSSTRPPANQRDTRSTYYSDLSSNPAQEDDNLLTSFPATPTIDQTPSLKPSSFQDFPQSDTASIESRRLMSVTKQEESLLAAMRSKKAALGQAYGASKEPRIQAAMYRDRKPTKRIQPGPRSSATVDVQVMSRPPWVERVQSPSSDTNFDQASCTTFQTGPSIDPSARYSITSFRTDVESDIGSSAAGFSPALIPPPNAALNRMSRSTFFSSSSTSSRDNSRNRKENHYLATLEKLQAAPKRDEVSSQDFIDWPYDGWMKVATAH